MARPGGKKARPRANLVRGRAFLPPGRAKLVRRRAFLPPGRAILPPGRANLVRCRAISPLGRANLVRPGCSATPRRVLPNTPRAYWPGVAPRFLPRSPKKARENQILLFRLVVAALVPANSKLVAPLAFRRGGQRVRCPARTALRCPIRPPTRSSPPCCPAGGQWLPARATRCWCRPENRPAVPPCYWWSGRCP